MRIAGITAVVALALAASLQAAPVEFAHVAADAGWLAHVDADAARQTVVYKKAYRKLVKARPNLEKQLDALRTLLDMDVRKDLRGITVYGKRLGAPEGVLLIHADLNQKSLSAKAQWLPDHKVTAYGAHELHSWTDAKGKDGERTLAGAFFSPTLAVFAAGLADVQAALDVLDGRSPHLAKDSLLAAPVPPDAAVVVRAVGLPSAKLPFKSPLVTQSEAISIALGERGGELFADARLTMKSPEAAEQVKSILEGLRAMAELQAGEDSDVKGLLRRFKARQADRAVTVEFRAPPEAVWAVAERCWNPMAALERSPKGSPKQ